jgi:PEP-CTERM motif
MRPVSKIALFAASSLVVLPNVRADVVTEWDQLATNAIVADIPTNVYAVSNPSAPVTNPSALGLATSNISANAATRDLAIESIAVQDAVAPLLGGSQTYLPAAAPNGPTDATAAAATAAYDALNATVLTQLAGYTSPTQLTGVAAQQEAIWTAHLNADLAGIPDTTQAINNGIAYGNSAAAAIITNRTGDGSATPPAGPTTTQYVGAWNGTPISASNPAAQNGQWIPTPINQQYTNNPAYASALTGKSVTIDSNGDLAQYGAQPWWGGVKTFSIPNATIFAPAAPPVESSAAFQTALAQIQTLGSSANLTSTDPTVQAHVHLAELWAQDIEVPIQQVTQEVAQAEGNGLAQDARLFALVNIASADARITTWNTKYSNGGIRPITVLNPTYDPSGWQPLITTPNHPEYDSGHSATASAAFNVLSDYYGTDTIPDGGVEVGSYLYDPETGDPVAPINYTSYSQLITDVGNARIYGGVHFQFTIDATDVVGANVADFVFDNTVTVPEPASLSVLGIAGAGLLMRRRQSKA